MQTETETGWRKQQGRTYIDKNDVETIAWIRGIPTWRKSAGQQSVQAVDSIVCQKESD